MHEPCIVSYGRREVELMEVRFIEICGISFAVEKFSNTLYRAM